MEKSPVPSPVDVLNFAMMTELLTVKFKILSQAIIRLTNLFIQPDIGLGKGFTGDLLFQKRA